MRTTAKSVRLCALLTAFLALSAMAGCPESSEFQNGNHGNDRPADHAGPGAMGRTMGGGMGGMGMP
jgi:hypothetical protein